MSESAPINHAASAKGRLSDLRVLWHLMLHPVKGRTHEDRLESFYGGQAGDYDSFRERLLHGRDDVLEHLQFSPGMSWVDMGAGTGRNVLQVADRLTDLKQVLLVDLSQSMLNVAGEKLKERRIENASCLHADATMLNLPAESVDIVTFFYSLTMIPNWFAAIELAHRILKPGGTIAVADFYVSRKYPEVGHRRHSSLARLFWTNWFSADGVYLSSDHPAMLEHYFQVGSFSERFGKVPYMPLIRAPYYTFIGRKAEAAS
ncbi:class I SAM-dependent methyltransferase [Roseiconus lacunae]|uniref:class I SAM-dependent methyltransferase n=1 Tax=Roseiconus lacunae TaxID=2605694 RepID=UPI0028F42F10|nr:methyltransferase domain-containing protein [Roseiconus lacunae]